MDQANLFYVEREIEHVLNKTIKSFPSIAVTGPRQTGKSTLLKHLFKKTHSFVTFDDPLVRERANSDPKLFIENIPDNVIFDEIQYSPHILSYIKMKIDGERGRNGRYVFTGSQQFHLIKNLGDSLAGRIALFELAPFSINEKSRIKSIKPKASGILNYFIHGSLRGSFPEISSKPSINSDLWYSSYLQTYLERDIRTIYNISSLREYQKFIHLLASRCSQILNLSSYAKELGVSVNTIKNWISILEAGRIIYVLPPYYRNYGKRITKNPKIYFIDIGLICYLTGIKAADHLLNGPMAGQLFENFVMQETIKGFLNKGKRPNIYYLRTNNNLEIDLIIEENMKVYPFEIKFTKSPNARMAESIERMKTVFPKLSIEPGKIISLSDENVKISKNASLQDMESYINWIRNLK